MIPAEFEYARPRDVGETLRILSEHAGDAKVLSGGYSLLPLLKLRLASPSLVVDIGHVEGLDGIAEQNGELRIGARVTHARLAADATVAAGYPVVHEAAGGADATNLAWAAEVNISGTLASVGARLIQGTAEKMIRQTFDCIRTKLEA